MPGWSNEIGSGVRDAEKLSGGVDLRMLQLQKLEMILAEFNQAFLLHAAEFLGEGTPVDIQEIGKLFPVEGNIELSRAEGACHTGEVVADPLPDLLRGNIKDMQ